LIVWFLAIARRARVLVIAQRRRCGAPSIPARRQFFAANGLMGFACSGAVFSPVTGARRLYADMGTSAAADPHRVVRLVLPALLINYLGQGALLLANTAAEHPFFDWRRRGRLIRCLRLPPSAAFIAFAALISGSFLDSRGRRCSSGWRRPRRPAHSAHAMGQGLCPARQLGVDGATVADRDRLPFVERDGGGPTALRDADDDHTAAACFIVRTERWRWPLPLAGS
jgi:KUP system potassium uptake protein